MSKKKDKILLIPGSHCWEVWKGGREQGFLKVLADGPEAASSFDKLPLGSTLLMAFPAREVLAVPFKVKTDDESLFKDLAKMHLEKISVRPAVDAGQLTDVFLAGKKNGESTLLSIVLAAPSEESLPPRSPEEFDITPRLFPMESDAVTLWQELGRWVFAVTCGSHLLYFQSLAGTGGVTEVVRDIRLALHQLKIQGLDIPIKTMVVWTTKEGSEFTAEQVKEFEQAMRIGVVLKPKPAPVLPLTLSKLLPADVHTEQRRKADKMKRNLLLAAVCLIYFGVIGYFGWKYWRVSNQIKKQNKELKTLLSDYNNIGDFNDQWDELRPVVDQRHWAINLLKRANEMRPANQQDMRFTRFEVKKEEVFIEGYASGVKVTTAYEARLKRALPDYKWTTPPAEPDSKTKQWKFHYKGILKGSEIAQ